MYEDIIRQYRDLDDRLADFHYKVKSEDNYETIQLIPTEEAYEALKAELEELGKEVEALPAPTKPCEVWKAHFHDFVFSEKNELEGLFANPARIFDRISFFFIRHFRNDARPDVMRADIIEKKLSQVPAIMDAIRSRAGKLTDKRKAAMVNLCNHCARTTRGIIPKIPSYMKQASFDAEKVAHLAEVMNTYCDRLEAFAAEPLWQTDIPKEDVNNYDLRIPFDEKYYRDLLHDLRGVELDELLSWYEEEIEKTRENVYRIARALPIPENDPKSMADVKAILDKYAGAPDNPEEVLIRGRKYLDRAQAGGRKYVWYPEDEYCQLYGACEYLKYSWPWGGAGSGNPRQRPLMGVIWYNDANYTAVTDGWMKMMSIHETYPGHHIQFVRCTTDKIPETAKIGACHMPLIEGTAHRSEHVFEWIYEEDPFYPLFVAYRRHHTAVRIKVDLMLRYFGKTIGEAVQVYKDELAFDERSARGQVKQHEEMEGYFVVYYYGYKKLTEWEEKYGYDVKTYSELLFSVGKISVNNFEKFLQMNKAEKESFCSDFYSKRMDIPYFVNTNTTRFDDPVKK